MKKRKCRSCHSYFLPERSVRKYCSQFCYRQDLRKNKKPAKDIIFNIRNRKEMMAFGGLEQEQFRQLAFVLNSKRTFADVEKVALIGMAMAQSESLKATLAEYFGSMTPAQKRRAREILIRNPGRPPPRGPFFCRECQVRQIDRPYGICDSCRHKRAESTEPTEPKEIPDIGDEPLVGNISRDDVRKKDRSDDF